MRRCAPAAIFGTLLLLGGCSDLEPAPDRVGSARGPIEPADEPRFELVRSLGVGTGSDEVSIRQRGEEVHAGGPSAIAVSGDGLLAVADTLAGRVIRVAPQGDARAPLAMYGVEDVLFDADERLYAFSRTSSRVAVFDADGQETESVDLPRTMRWITGLCTMPDGGVGLHTAYQESVDLDAQYLHRELGEGVPGPGGERYRTIRRDGEAFIEVLSGSAPGARRIAVDAATPLGSLELVGATSDGEIVVDMQDVVGSGPIEVERSLRRYGSEGTLRRQVAVPRGLYVPAHPFELASDGTVYVLVPTSEGVDIRAWRDREGGGR